MITDVPLSIEVLGANDYVCIERTFKFRCCNGNDYVVGKFLMEVFCGRVQRSISNFICKVERTNHAMP